MIWADLFDGLFSASSAESEGTGGAKFAQYALAEFAAQVPYIGQYLGFYFSGYEDLSDLTYIPDYSQKKDGRNREGRAYIEADPGADAPGAKKFDFSDPWNDVMPEGETRSRPRNELLSNPNLLADNSLHIISVETYIEIRKDTGARGAGELSLDTGRPYRPPSRPRQPEQTQEVVIRAPHPDRGQAQPIGNPPHYLRVHAPRGSRPETLAPRRPEAEAPPVQRLQEIVITAPIPFSPDVSDPEALEHAEGMGHIELGDLEQLPRGNFNGIISAWQSLAHASVRTGMQQLAGPLAPSITPYLEEPIQAADGLRLPIDPRHGGAGIMGDKLGENLVFEALPFVPYGLHLPAEHASDVERLEKAIIEHYASKQMAEEVVVLESQVAKRKGGWSQAELLNHLRRLEERGSVRGKWAHDAYKKAIKELGSIPRQRGREIFWDPRWLKPG